MKKTNTTKIMAIALLSASMFHAKGYAGNSAKETTSGNYVCAAAYDALSVTTNTIIPKNNQSSQGVITPKTNANSNARHDNDGDYDGVTYDASLGMLVFKDSTSYTNTMILLAKKLQDFQYDKGQTAHLLQLLNSENRHSDDLYDALADNSPLSDTVLITFLNGHHAQQKIKQILELNIDFGDKVEAAFDSLKLDSLIAKEINSKRFDHVPYDPVLDGFEAKFPGFTSYRDFITQQEFTFLKAGGDPADSANPGNKNAWSRLSGTLINANQEVKVGTSFFISLPGRDIKIKNNRVDILNYIRKNGNIPFNQPLANEPANGFPIGMAPPPVDTSIVVTPTGGPIEMPNGCGNGVTPTSKSDRVSFSFSLGIKDNVSYYWNFGDGFVSYKPNPTHTYANNGAVYKVIGTAYTSYGAPCGGGITVGTGNNNNSTSGCISMGGGQVTQSFDPTTNVASFNATPPLGYHFTTFSWIWDDGSANNSGPSLSVSHNYTNYGYHHVTVSSFDGVANVCWNKDIYIQISAPVTTYTTPCCSTDKVVYHHFDTDNGFHRFKVSLTLHHNSRINVEELTAEIASYTRFSKHPLLYLWAPATTTISLNGYWYTQDINNNPCGNQQGLNQTQTHYRIWNTLPPNTQGTSVEDNSAHATGSYQNSIDEVSSVCH